jgi:hypothetical protein
MHLLPWDSTAGSRLHHDAQHCIWHKAKAHLLLDCNETTNTCTAVLSWQLAQEVLLSHLVQAARAAQAVQPRNQDSCKLQTGAKGHEGLSSCYHSSIKQQIHTLQLHLSVCCNRVLAGVHLHPHAGRWREGAGLLPPLPTASSQAGQQAALPASAVPGVRGLLVNAVLQGKHLCQTQYIVALSYSSGEPFHEGAALAGRAADNSSMRLHAPTAGQFSFQDDWQTPLLVVQGELWPAFAGK